MWLFGSIARVFVKPQSTTIEMCGIVTEVSATFVEKITRRVVGGCVEKSC